MIQVSREGQGHELIFKLTQLKCVVFITIKEKPPYLIPMIGGHGTV